MLSLGVWVVTPFATGAESVLDSRGNVGEVALHNVGATEEPSSWMSMGRSPEREQQRERKLFVSRS